MTCDATYGFAIGDSGGNRCGSIDLIAKAGTVVSELFLSSVIQLISDNGDVGIESTNNDVLLTGVTIRVGGPMGIETSPAASAALDVASTTKGLAHPRITSTQRDAISSPINGLTIYNTSTNKLHVRAGGAWVDLH